jgi:hypothetical protein
MRSVGTWLAFAAACLLDRLRAAHGVDHAVELAEHGVPRGVDDTSVVRLDDPQRAIVELANQSRGASSFRPIMRLKPETSTMRMADSLRRGVEASIVMRRPL